MLLLNILNQMSIQEVKGISESILVFHALLSLTLRQHHVGLFQALGWLERSQKRSDERKAIFSDFSLLNEHLCHQTTR